MVLKGNYMKYKLGLHFAFTSDNYAALYKLAS